MKKQHCIATAFTILMMIITTNSMSDDIETQDKLTTVQMNEINAREPFDYSNWEGRKIELNFEDMVSLPPNTIIVSGYYDYGAGPVHSALFISRDGAQTWKEINVKVRASTITNLCSFSTSHIWGLVTHRNEGTYTPTHLLRSVNQGQSWTVTILEFMHQHEGLFRTKDFQFYDDRHGLLTITNSAIGELSTYCSKDGGESWKQLWDIQTDRRNVERGYGYPKRSTGMSEQIPLHTPIWEKEFDVYTIKGLVRVREKEDRFVLETYEYGKEGWTIQSEIPRFYEIKINELVLRSEP